MVILSASTFLHVYQLRISLFFFLFSGKITSLRGGDTYSRYPTPFLIREAICMVGLQGGCCSFSLLFSLSFSLCLSAGVRPAIAWHGMIYWFY
jgi:hypothetical protein